MTNQLRPTTNLVIPEHLMLPKKDLKSRFMFVYAKGYTGSPVTFMTRLWASVLFPSIAHDPMFGVGKKKGRIADALQKQVPASYLRVKTVHDARDPHTVVSVPVFSFKTSHPFEIFSFLKTQFLKASTTGILPQPNAQQNDELAAIRSLFAPAEDGTPPVRDIVFTTSQVLKAFKGMTEATTLNLKSTLLQMRIQTKGALAVVFFDFKITKEEAQQLTTTEFAQMRDIDIYPLLLQWVLSSYGERGNAPTASFPISKIATTLPRSHVQSARVNELGLSVGPNGRPFYFPREIDVQQTIQYEERYTQAGTRADGSYALTDINEGAHALETGTEIKVKLPRNVPVLIDWVNNKYSYTDTSGLLKVQDLMRYRKAESAHLRILLEERVCKLDHITMFAKMAEKAGIPLSAFMPSQKDVEDVKNVGVRMAFMRCKTPHDWFEVAVEAWEQVNEEGIVHFGDLSVDGFGPFRPLARFIKTAVKPILENLPAVYRDYSVKTVSENLPWMIMIDAYCSTEAMDALRTTDTESRAEAINQGIDPNWVPKPIPMIDALREIGYLPHQTKVRNLLREAPLFAIMPVQAGGGKSLLLITDILYEILYHRSHPYILLCPGHLVSNYVNEVLYFTGGQLNVIPITSEVIRVHGYERLQAIVEASPRNTVIVCDYDTLRYRQRSICYGTTPVLVYPVIDFLRQFRFGYVGLDESHKVKNDTARTKATMCLITDIPKVRLASGTMAHDSPSDLAMQVAAMDPTLFGTREEFNHKYGLVVSGGRVMHWRPGAQEQIRRKINSRVVTAGAMRKEWAAFLPTKREWIGGVNLTDAQQTVYDAILEETLDKIEEAARTNKELSKFLGRYDSRAMSEDVEEYTVEEDDEHDEEAGSDLAALLKPYLARLERFLMAPGKDELGGKLLFGDDLKSPKVMAILERIRLHLFGGSIRVEGEDVPYGPFPGKCLIFTNNIISAEEVWELAPPELKRCGLLYKAENKVEHGQRFEKMERIRWMVGVEVSMNEGLNFQFVSRTVRTEQVWNPGTQEQGNSRSNRPQLKVADLRQFVFYDTIVVNNTIDITKTARLISKVISVAKFENSENPAYATIPDVPIIKMSLDSIQSFNTWHKVSEAQPGLEAYAKALAVYEQVRDKDYEEYKLAYIRQYGEGPVKKMLKIAPTPPDAKLLSLVPYAPGSNVYGQEKLGLTRVDEYLNLIEDELVTGADDDVEDVEFTESEPDFSPVEAKALALRGRSVHTEFGEGTISRCGTRMKYISVQLRNGFTVPVRKSATFLMDKDLQSPVRSEMASILQIALSEVRDIPALGYKMTREQSKTKRIREIKRQAREARARERHLRKALTLDISLVISNGYAGLAYDVDEQNLTAIQTLQACGFRLSPSFYYARVPTSLSFVRLINEWEERGISYDPKFLKSGARSWFAEMFAQLKNGIEEDPQRSIVRAAKAKLPLFYRTEHRASADKKLIKPYPVLEDGTAYIALPKDGQPGSRLAIKHSRGAIKWGEAGPRLSFFGTIKEIQQVAKRMKEAGVVVRNPSALNSQFRRMRKLKVRVL